MVGTTIFPLGSPETSADSSAGFSVTPRWLDKALGFDILKKPPHSRMRGLGVGNSDRILLVLFQGHSVTFMHDDDDRFSHEHDVLFEFIAFVCEVTPEKVVPPLEVDLSEQI